MSKNFNKCFKKQEEEKNLKFFISLSITLFLILTFYELVNILNINEYAAFYVEDNIDYTLKYSDTLDDLLLSYKEIIIIHRKINSRNAYSFSKAINYLVFLFIFIIIFLIMKGGK